MSQDLDSMVSPVQTKPPYCGAGFVHERSRVWFPVSHVTEHSDHSDQSVKPPSTGKIIILDRNVVHMILKVAL